MQNSKAKVLCEFAFLFTCSTWYTAIVTSEQYSRCLLVLILRRYLNLVLLIYCAANKDFEDFKYRHTLSINSPNTKIPSISYILVAFLNVP